MWGLLIKGKAQAGSCFQPKTLSFRISHPARQLLTCSMRHCRTYTHVCCAPSHREPACLFFKSIDTHSMPLLCVRNSECTGRDIRRYGITEQPLCSSCQREYRQKRLSVYKKDGKESYCYFEDALEYKIVSFPKKDSQIDYKSPALILSDISPGGLPLSFPSSSKASGSAFRQTENSYPNKTFDDSVKFTIPSPDQISCSRAGQKRTAVQTSLKSFTEHQQKIIKLQHELELKDEQILSLQSQNDSLRSAFSELFECINEMIGIHHRTGILLGKEK